MEEWIEIPHPVIQSWRVLFETRVPKIEYKITESILFVSEIPMVKKIDRY